MDIEMVRKSLADVYRRVGRRGTMPQTMWLGTAADIGRCDPQDREPPAGCDVMDKNSGQRVREMSGNRAQGPVTRREFGGTASALALALWAEAVFGQAAFAQAPGETVETITPDHVKRLAERLAAREFQKPKLDVPEPFSNLTVEQYRDIRFRADQALFRGEKLDFEVQGLPIGHIFRDPVEIWVVDGGRARLLRADGKLFALGGLIGKVPDAAPYAFSGLRVHGPVNRAESYDDYLVFQGASYFRAIARGQVYGLAARGLAINTARPGGEEFPQFRAFWVEKPRPGSTELVIQALLDSPSTTGAYRFAVQPGILTTIAVEMTLFPRRPLQHVGLAPLTSMFLTGPASRRIGGDARPEVHDSEGLAMVNGAGERIWRPLCNPRKLQASAFVDRNPRGFGLVQRDRAFSSFEDLEAQYHRRPSVWVEPKGGWGEGYVELIEIPSEEEIHDNIVAYWKPAKELEGGKAHTFAYTLSWGDQLPLAWAGAKVRKTRVGSRRPDVKQFVIDFDGPAIKELRELPQAMLQASAGTLTNVVTQRNPEIDGLRVMFELNTSGHETIELRLTLKSGEQTISESWIHRWTRA